MKKPISVCHYGQFCPKLTLFGGRDMDCCYFWTTVFHSTEFILFFFFFGTNVQYSWPCFGEICFIANALWVMWHLVSNQDSIFFREHIVQAKNSLFEKVQKPGHFVIDKHKGNLLTYCCFKNYFTFAFSPPPLFFNLHKFLWSFHFK